VENNLERWCQANPERCRPVAERLEDLIDACRAGDAAMCRRLVILCERNPGLCAADKSPRPGVLPPLERRLAPEPTATPEPPPVVAGTPVTQNLPPLPFKPIEVEPVKPALAPVAPTSLPEPSLTPFRDLPPKPASTSEDRREPTPTQTPVTRFSPLVRPTSTPLPRSSASEAADTSGARR
jgi:hypothetical protein